MRFIIVLLFLLLTTIPFFFPLCGRAFFHSAPDEVHHSPFIFATDHCAFFLFFLCGRFSREPDLTPNYPTHFPTFISSAPTLVPYLLSPTNITTLITNYFIDLVTVLTTYLTNLATLFPPKFLRCIINF
jgi:hypothetical protein